MNSWWRLRNWSHARIDVWRAAIRRCPNLRALTKECPPCQIPRFDSVLLMALTIWTSLGCDFSKPSTDERNP